MRPVWPLDPVLGRSLGRARRSPALLPLCGLPRSSRRRAPRTVRGGGDPLTKDALTKPTDLAGTQTEQFSPPGPAASGTPDAGALLDASQQGDDERSSREGKANKQQTGPKGAAAGARGEPNYTAEQRVGVAKVPSELEQNLVN